MFSSQIRANPYKLLEFLCLKQSHGFCVFTLYSLLGHQVGTSRTLGGHGVEVCSTPQKDPKSCEGMDSPEGGLQRVCIQGVSMVPPMRTGGKMTKTI